MKKRYGLHALGAICLSGLLLAGCGSSMGAAQTENTQTAGSAAADNAQVTTQEESAQNTSEQITKNQARSIALQDAGFQKSDVAGLTIVLDIDHDANDPDTYDVTFHANGQKYEYEIHAVDGTILSREIEKSDYVPEDDAARESAKNAALEDAGLKESEVTALTVEEDRDNGQLRYEVEFVSGETEYTYEIAEDGTILERESERVYD